MLSNKQKKLLHMIPAKLGIDSAERRVIQQNIGGFYSSADQTASHAGFAAVMAHYEAKAGGKLDYYTAGYWKGQAGKADGQHGDTSRLLWRIRKEAERLNWEYPGDVEAFLASDHMSCGQYTSVDDCPVYWLTRTLDAMLAMIKRMPLLTG